MGRVVGFRPCIERNGSIFFKLCPITRRTGTQIQTAEGDITGGVLDTAMFLQHQVKTPISVSDLGLGLILFFLAPVTAARPRLANISSGISQMSEINLLRVMAVFSDCRKLFPGGRVLAWKGKWVESVYGSPQRYRRTGLEPC